MCEAVRKYGDEREYRGRAEGRAEGQQQERKDMIRNALKMNMPLTTVAQLVGLSVEEVQKLIDEMEH